MDLPTEAIAFHGTSTHAVPHLLAGDIQPSDQHFEWLGTGFLPLAGLAVAGQAHNPKVAGSNPAPATNDRLKAQVTDLGLRRWVSRLPGSGGLPPAVPPAVRTNVKPRVPGLDIRHAGQGVGRRPRRRLGDLHRPRDAYWQSFAMVDDPTGDSLCCAAVPEAEARCY